MDIGSWVKDIEGHWMLKKSLLRFSCPSNIFAFDFNSYFDTDEFFC